MKLGDGGAGESLLGERVSSWGGLCPTPGARESQGVLAAKPVGDAHIDQVRPAAGESRAQRRSDVVGVADSCRVQSQGRCQGDEVDVWLADVHADELVG